MKYFNKSNKILTKYYKLIWVMIDIACQCKPLFGTFWKFRVVKRFS